MTKSKLFQYSFLFVPFLSILRLVWNGLYLHMIMLWSDHIYFCHFNDQWIRVSSFLTKNHQTDDGLYLQHNFYHQKYYLNENFCCCDVGKLVYCNITFNDYCWRQPQKTVEIIYHLRKDLVGLRRKLKLLFQRFGHLFLMVIFTLRKRDDWLTVLAFLF